MGRRPQPHLREALLDACTDHALEHGLPDRMGPLAAAAGTSTRMLVYHFSDRDSLLRAVLRRARDRQLADFGDLLRVRGGEPYRDTLQRAWTGISGATGRPYLRIFGERREGAVDELWPGFRTEATTDWLAPLAEGLGSPELATLALAVIRGLLADLDATGDVERTDAAFARFVALLDAPSGTEQPS